MVGSMAPIKTENLFLMASFHFTKSRDLIFSHSFINISPSYLCHSAVSLSRSMTTSPWPCTTPGDSRDSGEGQRFRQRAHSFLGVESECNEARALDEARGYQC